MCNARIFYIVTYGHALPPGHHTCHAPIVHLIFITILRPLVPDYLNILQNFETSKNDRTEEILGQSLGHADLLTYVPRPRRRSREKTGRRKKRGKWVTTVGAKVLLGMYQLGGVILYILHVQRAERTINRNRL